MQKKASTEVERALKHTALVHKYLMAIDHALLWVAALSFAAFFHLSPDYTKAEALLFSTLVAYCAYLCESGLETLKTAAAMPMYKLDFKKGSLWGMIVLNIATCTVLSLLFLMHPSWIWLVLIIFTAGWQKYMDGRIPPRLQSTKQKIKL
ncbi:MAG: hypothetical protein K2M06_06650 [Muribaculaceae bacterium]|nr:hypothetical protein [Muribaculaceae bacterium]